MASGPTWRQTSRSRSQRRPDTSARKSSALAINICSLFSPEKQFNLKIVFVINRNRICLFMKTLSGRRTSRLSRGHSALPTSTCKSDLHGAQIVFV
jgi:hypothetical protein